LRDAEPAGASGDRRGRIRFDVRTFNWIATPRHAEHNQLLTTTGSAPSKTDDAELIVGRPHRSGSSFIRMRSTAWLARNSQIVTGIPAATTSTSAMERGGSADVAELVGLLEVDAPAVAREKKVLFRRRSA